MANADWTRLSTLQLGTYAEYFAKMEFASYGLEVYTSEVDDRGIDFIVCDKHGRFCEIQVKSLRGTGYIFAQKSKFNKENERLYMAVLLFEQLIMPHIYLIPATRWQVIDNVFVERDYDKPGQTSKPEYGINVSNRNLEVLEQFRFSSIIQGFL